MNASDILPQTGYLQMWLKPQDVDVVARFDEVSSISEVRKMIAQMWTARIDINIMAPANRCYLPSEFTLIPNTFFAMLAERSWT
jgi:hypothetical protein